MERSESLGQEPIGKLLLKQAVPASIGFLVMTVYSIVDTIYVGQFIGSLALAAVTVVTPISFLISSIGMAIGVGGASVISRAMGANNYEKASNTLGNMIGFTISLSLLIVILGFSFLPEIIHAFGGKGDILEPASTYFGILLLGGPLLAWLMMSNNVIRSQGKAKMAMLTLGLSAVLNIILDPIFIFVLDWGLAGAAWATVVSYTFSTAYATYFFFSRYNELRLKPSDFRPNFGLLKEIFSIGGISLARQASVSVLAIVLNNSLFAYGGELAVAVYGIINRVMMFSIFPVIGVVQGFLPIAGYNYGAENWERVKDSIKTAGISGTVIASVGFFAVLLFPGFIVSVFTSDLDILIQTPGALITVFLATPLIGIQLIGSAYFQAIGKALPALLLTMTKQGFFLIPLVLTMPLWFGLEGIWYSFPIADIMAATITAAYTYREVKRKLLRPQV